MIDRGPTAGKPLEPGRLTAPWPRRFLIGAFVLTGFGALGLVGSDMIGVAPVKLVGLNLQVLRDAVAAQPWLVAGSYCLTYMGLAALFLPGSPLMTLIAGVLFGPVIGVLLALVGTTLAAVTGFGVARWLGAGRMTRIGHPAFLAVREGFQRNALSYLLFLRFSPGLPFALVNAAPAVLGVPLTTFIGGTLLGSIPSRLALSTAGAGLGGMIDAQNMQYARCLAAAGGNDGACPYVIDTALLLTWQTVAAFVALALLALAPALFEFALASRRGAIRVRAAPKTPARPRCDP